jgi:acyl-CoA synthetase (AMP-forming)/AMP-acid ligase II
MHVAVLPDARAARNPHGLALADEQNGELTSAHLLQRVQVAAEHLAKAGVGAGDVVAVKLPNRGTVRRVVAGVAAGCGGHTGQSLPDTDQSRLPAQRLVGARSKLTEDQGWQLSAGDSAERLRGAADAAEGPRAVAEKRPAIWKGR